MLRNWIDSYWRAIKRKDRMLVHHVQSGHRYWVSRIKQEVTDE